MIDATSALLELVDPELREIAASLAPFVLDPASLETTRAAFAEQTTVGKELHDDEVRRRLVQVRAVDSDTPIQLLIYEPPPTSKRVGAILDIHGGGFVFGSAAMNDSQNSNLVRELGVSIVCVDYRLAPEQPYPASLHDCLAALRFVRNQEELGGAADAPVIVLGNSAGGGLAAALSLWLRDHDEPPFEGQVLLSPMLDDNTGQAENAVAGRIGWNEQNNRYAWESLLGDWFGRDDVPYYAAPARAPSLEAVPPTFISVGSLDLFAGESLDFARRLVRAGVPTELHLYPGAFHGFARFAPDADVTRRNFEDYTSALKSMLGQISKEN